jgi:hypothetical protein
MKNIEKITEDNLEVFKTIVLNDKDSDRERLRCVYFDSENNCVVATDAHKMLIVNKDVQETKLINFKTKEVLITSHYVAYNNVLPLYSKGVVNISLNFIIDGIKNIIKENSKLTFFDKKRIYFTVDNEDIYFEPKILNEGIKALKHLGYENVTMLYLEPKMGVQFVTDDNLVRLLIMPIAFSDDFKSNRIAIFQTESVSLNSESLILNKIKYQLNEDRYGLKDRINTFEKNKEVNSPFIDSDKKGLIRSINENKENMELHYSNYDSPLVKELNDLIVYAESIIK